MNVNRFITLTCIFVAIIVIVQHWHGFLVLTGNEHHNLIGQWHFLLLWVCTLALWFWKETMRLKFSVGFKLRVFISILDKPFRIDQLFVTWFLYLKVQQVFVELASQMCFVMHVYSFVSLLNTEESCWCLVLILDFAIALEMVVGVWQHEENRSVDAN